jgi:arylsulfatase A-like enzyme
LIARLAVAVFWTLAVVVGTLLAHQGDGLVSLASESRWWALGILAVFLVIALAWEFFWILLRRRHLVLSMSLPLVLTGLLACLLVRGEGGRITQDGQVPASGPDLVLVTLDTFRADRVGDLTPNLMALSHQGAIFTVATTTTPLTAPAHASMLTGLLPREHGLVRNGGQTSASSVAETLQSHGYRTGAFLGARVLDRSTGLYRAFDHYDDRFGFSDRSAWLPGARLFLSSPPHAERRCDVTVHRALRWLGEREGPAFLWVHLYDPHTPYDPPEAWRPRQGDIAQAQAFDATARRWGGKMSVFDLVMTQATMNVQEQKLLYDAEIRWTDACVGALLAGLDRHDIVIVAGDHGESLDEHSYYFNHGGDLFDPSVRVPLLARAQGWILPDVRVESPVSITRVASTLLRVAGLPRLGPDLLDAAAGEAEPQPVFLWTPGQQVHSVHVQREQHRWFQRASRPSAALRYTEAKIVATGTDEAAYYDLLADPGEAHPLEVPEELKAAAAQVEAAARQEVKAPSAEEVERLRAIGYSG